MPANLSAHEEIRRRTRNALRLAVPDAEIPRLRAYDHMASWVLFQRAGAMEWWDPPVGEIKPLNVKKVEVKDEDLHVGEGDVEVSRGGISAPVTPTTLRNRYSSSDIALIEEMPVVEVLQIKKPPAEPTGMLIPSTHIAHGPSRPSSPSASTSITAIFTTPSSATHTTTTARTTPTTNTTPSPRLPHLFEAAPKSGPDSICHVHYTPQGNFRGSREEFRVSFAFDADPARSVVLQERPLVANSVVAGAKERRLSGQETWPAVPERQRMSGVLVKKKRRSLRVSPSVAWKRLLGGRTEEESA